MKNKGLSQHRLSSNPLEKKYAEAWEEINTDRIDGRLNGRSTLDYLLSGKSNIQNGEVTDRDRQVAATVIQWLGSPVGQEFINKVLDRKECIQQKNKGKKMDKKQERLHAALTELHLACIDACSDLTTSVSVHINCQGYNTEVKERTPESLRKDGISMRNIKGEFIK